MADRYNLIYSGEQVNTAIGRGLTSLQPTAQTLSDIQKQTVRTNIGAMGALNIYNPNLLINGDFAINQRGASSYTGAYTYTVDRWQHGTSFLTASVLSKGVRLTASTSGTTGTYYYLYNQTIEDYAKYAGKIVTATLAYENNTFINGRINIRCDTTSNYSTATMSTSGIITFTLTLPSNITSSLKFLITGNHTNGTEETIDLLYAKLEIGSIATPFVPPLIAEEFSKCQRYANYKWGVGDYYTVLGTAIANSTTDARAYLPLTQSPRIIPSVLWSGIALWNGSTQFTASEVAVNWQASNGAGIKITTTGLTEHATYMVVLTANVNSYIGLDAEIY